jgi:RNA polymerase sigma-70 factor (ECF subfamily)
MADEGRLEDSRPGKRSGFAVDWDSARPAVFAQLLAGIGSYHDAEDVLQDVAISIAENYDKYDASRPFVGWALGFARIHILRYYERSTSSRMVFDEAMLKSMGDYIVATSAQQASPRSEALFHCLSALESDRRTLVEMRYAKDLSIDEIASRTNKSASAIKGTLHRARMQLKSCIELRLSLLSPR